MQGATSHSTSVRPCSPYPALFVSATCVCTESNVLNTAFLERMNALLASGEVPGLFEGQDYTGLMQDCKETFRKVKLKMTFEWRAGTGVRCRPVLSSACLTLCCSCSFYMSPCFFRLCLSLPRRSGRSASGHGGGRVPALRRPGAAQPAHRLHDEPRQRRVQQQKCNIAGSLQQVRYTEQTNQYRRKQVAVPACIRAHLIEAPTDICLCVFSFHLLPPDA